MPELTYPQVFPQLESLIPALLSLLRRADSLALSERQHLSVQRKDDKSLVTQGDLAVENLLIIELSRLFPKIPIVSEESPESWRLSKGDELFFLLDPIDATRVYVEGGDHFTVNVGLVWRNTPILGAISAPAQGRLFLGMNGEGKHRFAFMQQGESAPLPLKVRATQEKSTLISNLSEGDAILKTLDFTPPVGEIKRLPSSLKFCEIASGRGDVYVSLAGNCAWDVAAGGAIAAGAGALMEALIGTSTAPFVFNRDTWRNTSFLVRSPTLSVGAVL